MRNTFNTSSATMRDNGNSSDDSSLKVIPLEQIQGDDDEDTFLLVAMAKEAERYVQSFPWCATLKEGIYADGIGGVIALFVFRADIKKLGDNQWIWVFVGDVPSAYMAMEAYKSPHDALDRYIEGLEEWIAAARLGSPLSGLIPIEAPTDPDTIGALASRTETLRQHILPNISRIAVL